MTSRKTKPLGSLILVERMAIGPKELFYPQNLLARLLCTLMGRSAFVSRDFPTLKRLGYEIKLKGGFLFVHI